MKTSHFLVSLLALSLSLNALAGPTVEEFLKEQEQERINREAGIMTPEPAKEVRIETPKRMKYDAYLSSSLSNYLTREQFENFQKEIKNKDNRSEVLEGKLITFNTKDPEGCNAARLEMKLGKEVCVYDPEQPLVSVVVMRPIEGRESFERKINFDGMTEKEKVLYKSLFDFSIMGAGMFGAIYALPESISKWDKSKGFSALAGQYTSRVKAGPVIDEDDWAVNYIGHPISGAYYYTMVRHQGFSALESAAFSFCMSTFFWEYGIEAFAEIPSIQDLILTPLIGSLLGEVFYSWGNAIENNGGKLLGSKRLGKTISVLMNPAGALGNQINKIFKYKLIQSAELSLVYKDPNRGTSRFHLPDFNNQFTPKTPTMGLQLKFKF